MKLVRVVCFSLATFSAFGVMGAQAQEPGSVPEAQAAPAAAPRGAIRISSGVIAGLKISGDAPVYPPEAKAQGISGSVVLHAIIGRDGHIESLQVVSGNADLSQAALDAVKTWVYKPYLLNGEPTEVDTTITVNFQLGGQAGPPSGDGYR